MAITQADITFIDKKVRPAADRLAQSYNFAKIVVAEWNARGGNAAIPNTSAAIADGSPNDGRPAMTGIVATNIISRLQEQIADFEATSSAKLNTVLAAAVNTLP